MAGCFFFHAPPSASLPSFCRPSLYRSTVNSSRKRGFERHSASTARRVRTPPGLAAGSYCLSSQMPITRSVLSYLAPPLAGVRCSDRPISHSHSLHVNIAPLRVRRRCGRQRRQRTDVLSAPETESGKNTRSPHSEIPRAGKNSQGLAP